MKSQLARSIEKIEKLPQFLQNSVRNFALGSTVPFVGKSGIQFEKTNPTEWIASIKNKKKVQNHLKQVHACAMILLAETLGVMIMAQNVDNDKIPLVKKIEADFVKRSTGGMRGVVQLTEAQQQFIQNNEKGEMEVEVIITDEAGVNPILVKVTSAWIPKNRKKS